MIQLAHLYIPYISLILRNTFSILINLKLGCSNRLSYFGRIFAFWIVHKIMAYHNWWHCRVVEIWYMIETKVLQNSIYPLLWVMWRALVFCSYLTKKKRQVIIHQNEFIIHQWSCGKLPRTATIYSHTIGLKTNTLQRNRLHKHDFNFKKVLLKKELQIT